VALAASQAGQLTDKAQTVLLHIPVRLDEHNFGALEQNNRLYHNCHFGWLELLLKPRMRAICVAQPVPMIEEMNTPLINALIFFLAA
jgi:hypothetical protein